jgi:protein-disulfide isomerase
MKLSTPLSILIAGVLISAGAYFGLKSDSGNSAQVEGESKTISPTAEAPTIYKTSIDDDAILGNRDTAKVAIVEFSDYECPYCKSFRDQALVQIKSNHIDTGEVIFVYRDLPLTFHNPAATLEAEAVECARSLGNDDTYYKYHDLVFENTKGNGSGITQVRLAELAQSLGLSSSKFNQCLDNGDFKEEVAKDLEDAGNVGISGTPGFIVGKLAEDGSVEGDFINGAQPYSVFKTAIAKYLN